jgi:hypothetical protein
MTEPERSAWLALYAAAWFQPTGGDLGWVRDDERARWCAQQANRALAALKEIATPEARLHSSDAACEVLR